MLISYSSHLVQQHRGFSFRCHFRAGGGTSASTSATATGCRCGTCRCFWCFSRIFRNFDKFLFVLPGVMKLTKNQRVELTQTLPKLDDIKVLQCTRKHLSKDDDNNDNNPPTHCSNTVHNIQIQICFGACFALFCFRFLILHTVAHTHTDVNCQKLICEFAANATSVSRILFWYFGTLNG